MYISEIRIKNYRNLKDKPTIDDFSKINTDYSIPPAIQISVFIKEYDDKSEPNSRFDNILMRDEHFEKGHEVGFSNSHFVNQLFIRFSAWGSFHKGG